jgi:hypothetical protein
LQADVRACAVRDHLERDVGLLAEFGQPGQLPSHHLGRADRTVQHAFIQPGERAQVRAKDLIEPFGQITGGTRRPVSIIPISEEL